MPSVTVPGTMKFYFDIKLWLVKDFFDSKGWNIIKKLLNPNWRGGGVQSSSSIGESRFLHN